MARPAVDALRDRGIDPRPALLAARIAEGSLAAIERRLPAVGVRALWEEAASAARDAAFGVRVAATAPRGTLDVIDYVFATSPDLRGGLERLVRYVRVVEDSANLELVVEPTVARLIRRGALSTPQFDEFAMTLLFVRSREASREQWTPLSLRLQHASRGDDESTRLFGCPLTFGAPHTELVFGRELLELPFHRSDSRLLEILERYTDSLLGSLPTNDTLAARASSAIATEMARGLPTLASTAAALHVGARTLQRRLAASGVTHSALVDAVRRDLALEHITDASTSITEIAYLLHFSDGAALYRAFKRWTGASPQSYRERLLRGTAPRGT